MVRLAIASPFFALALLFALRRYEPLRLALSADAADDPPAFFVTVAAIGLSVAALFAAVGFVVASSQFRRYGGFLVVAVLAVAVRALDADR